MPGREVAVQGLIDSTECSNFKFRNLLGRFKRGGLFASKYVAAQEIRVSIVTCRQGFWFLSCTSKSITSVSSMSKSWKSPWSSGWLDSFHTAGSQLEGFENVCYEARTLEELFLIVNRGNKWVRAVIGHETAGCIPSQCIMESKIGLYLPYWSDRQGRAITRLHIPSRMRQEVFVEKFSVMEELWRWMNAGTDWKIKPLSMSFLEKQDADADVKHEGWIAEVKGISKVSWRGRTFVLKDTGSDEEFNYLKRLSPHPNIVPIFGALCKRSEENNSDIQKAYFMEYISGGDLLSLIAQEKGLNRNLPPFSSHDALNILLQFANAVEHMHQEGVIHCDLKAENVLISTSDVASSSETTSRYRVKVADFGSAQECGGPDPFIAGSGTNWYAAPESLEQRQARSFVINHPHKIDAYSFGVVAFELLTGENYFEYYSKHCKKFGVANFKAGVIGGTLRPPLRQWFLHIKHFRERIIEVLRSEREFSERYWHLQQEDLISLVENCWHEDPAVRRSFRDICEGLGSIHARFLQELNLVRI